MRSWASLLGHGLGLNSTAVAVCPSLSGGDVGLRMIHKVFLKW